MILPKIFIFLLLSITSIFGDQFSFNFKCGRSTPTADLNSIMPLDGDVTLPYTYDETNMTFTIDYSIFESYQAAHPDIASLCIFENVMKFTDALRAECFKLHEESESEKIQSCAGSAYGQVTDLQERFPYPEYDVLKVLAGEHYHGDRFENTVHNLQNSCGDYNLSNVALTLNFIENELPNIFNNIDSECKVKLVRNYEERIQDQIEDASKLDATNPQRNRRIAGSQMLLDSLYKVLAENDYQFDLDLNHLSCNTIEETSVEDLSEMINLITDQFYCSPHQRGQNFSRDIDISAANSPSGIEHKYRLNYEDGKYNIEVNLEFGASREIDDNPNRFQEITKQCLENLNDIKGPNGEVMNISLYEGDSNAVDAPPLKYIALSESGARSNSSVWSVDIENRCHTITHEVLHIMGLCDEYPESSIGYVIDPETGEHKSVSTGAELKSFNCRALGDPNSIMRSPSVAYALASADAESSFTGYLCDKSLSDEECKSSAPTGVFSAEEVAVLNADVEELLPDSKFIVEEIKTEGTNLLNPRHFNTIIYPECREKNSVYYQCARAAYMTSGDVSGEEGVVCPDLPPECANGSLDWTK